MTTSKQHFNDIEDHFLSINGPFNHIRHKEGLEGLSDIPFVNLLEEFSLIITMI